MFNDGKMIVIDGLDGSGKSTQFELINSILSKKRSVKAISFPDYSNPSSVLVKMYLNGDFSLNANNVNAYAASSFYAVDRYASYKLYWEKNYLNGDIILASRYVSSNAIHQMEKLPTSEWDNFLEWLYDYEYVKLGLPVPNITIFLDMPVEVSQKLLSKRYNGDESRKDIHESDTEYLKKCRLSALYAAAKENWHIIECSDGESPLPVNDITRKILNIIEEVI
jgi:dTMP kinase